MAKGDGAFHFKGTLALALLVCACAAAGGALFLFRYGPDDEREYRRLMLVSNPALAGEAGQTPYTARQKRYGVQKDFSYVREGAPLKVRLLSEEAELILDRQADSTQIIEEMHGVRSFLQEELFYVLPDGREAIVREGGRLLLRDAPEADERSWVAADSGARPMQLLRYLEADTGYYSYRSDQCVASNVTVEKYILPGHELTTNLADGKLVMRGVADSVEFSMAGGEPRFKAQRLKAQVLMQGRL